MYIIYIAMRKLQIILSWGSWLPAISLFFLKYFVAVGGQCWSPFFNSSSSISLSSNYSDLLSRAHFTQAFSGFTEEQIRRGRSVISEIAEESLRPFISKLVSCDPTTTLVVGGSISAGSSNCCGSQGPKWSDRVEDFLRVNFPVSNAGLNHRVINKAHGGVGVMYIATNLRDILKSIERPIDLIVVEFACNDMLIKGLNHSTVLLHAEEAVFTISKLLPDTAQIWLNLFPGNPAGDPLLGPNAPDFQNGYDTAQNDYVSLITRVAYHNFAFTLFALTSRPNQLSNYFRIRF